MRKGRLGLGVVLAGAAALLGMRRAAYAPPKGDVARRAEATAYSGAWTHGYAEVNGVRLHYAEVGRGSGPLVMLLHGFPQCWYTWHSIMPRMATRFHLVAPDLRGYNWSDKPEGVSAYTLDKVGADIAALVEALGETNAHIVGHDWGGSVAWHMGIYHPERVDRLVVVNAPHPGAYARELRTPGQLLRSWYVFFFQLPLLSEAVLRLTVRRSMSNTAAVPGAFPGEALDVYENAVSQPGAATAMLNYYRAAVRSAPAQLQKTTPTITAPTLLLWGMKDRFLSPRLTEGLEEWVPNLRVRRVEESGHWLPEEMPGLVSDELLSFLSP